MPTFVGLAEQGFYKPFEILAQNRQAARDRRQRNQEMELRQQQFEQEQELQRQRLGQEERSLTSRTAHEGALTDRAKFELDRLKNPVEPTVGDGEQIAERVVDEFGRQTVKIKPKVRYPGTQIVQRPLPNGGTGLFKADLDPDTGQEKLTPYSPRSEQETRIGNELMQKINILALAKGQIPKLQEAITSSEHAGGPVSGKISSPFAWAFGPSKERLGFENLQAQTLAPLAKGILGETGALSEADMARYAPLLPTFNDTMAVRQFKLDKLSQLINEQEANILGNLKAAGYKNVDDLQNQMSGVNLQPPVTAPGNGAPPAAGPSNPVKVNSQEEYEGLRPGDYYADSTGNIRRKL